MIVVGLMAFFTSKGMEEVGQPSKVMIGYNDGNGFVKTDEGYVGGLTDEGRGVVTMLNGVGIASMISGVIVLLLSKAVREE